MISLFKNVKKAFFSEKYLNILFLVAIVGLLVAKIFLRATFLIRDQAYLYFFSSVAQSMAAIIALGGSVALFMYGHRVSSLKQLKQLTRDQFASHSWKYFFGVTDSLVWHDDQVITMAERYRDKAPSNLPANILNELSCLIIEMSARQNNINNFNEYSSAPIYSSFVPFILSLVLIPFSYLLSATGIGIYILVLTFFLITNSLRNIYVLYFIISSSDKRSTR